MPASYQRFGNIVSLTLGPIGGIVTVGTDISRNNTPGYLPTGEFVQIVYIHCLDSTGTSIGDYPGYIDMVGGGIVIEPTYGDFITDSRNQGIQYSTNIVYYSEVASSKLTTKN